MDLSHASLVCLLTNFHPAHPPTQYGRPPVRYATYNTSTEEGMKPQMIRACKRGVCVCVCVWSKNEAKEKQEEGDPGGESRKMQHEDKMRTFTHPFSKSYANSQIPFPPKKRERNSQTISAAHANKRHHRLGRHLDASRERSIRERWKRPGSEGCVCVCGSVSATTQNTISRVRHTK